MKVRAAVLEQTGGALHIAALDLQDPREGEVLVQLAATGVCHSDLNAIDGNRRDALPGGPGARRRRGGGGRGHRSDPGRAGGSRGSLLGAVLRCLLRVSSRAAVALLDGLPLDRLVSHRLPLADVTKAFELMRSGDALRVVLDLAGESLT